MPTTRPRHFVTESDELAAALDAAEQRWPGVSRAQLIVRLALAGDAAAEATRARRAERTRAAIRRHSGALSGLYRADELQLLRDDWPE